MTISAYSRVIVDTMLGWLKGFANWVLRLFNLAGSSQVNPLMWLSQNWLKLLVLLMMIGIAADVLVWLVRWRPHWIWFHKERVIVDDERFFDESDIREKLDPDSDDFLEKNWEERDYVVTSALANRPKGARSRGETGRDGKNGSGSFQRGEKRRKPGQSGADEKQKRERLARAEKKAQRIRAEREADLFGMDGSQPGVTDFYEDEVFNVNNLPKADDFPFEDKAQTEEQA